MVVGGGSAIACLLHSLLSAASAPAHLSVFRLGWLHACRESMHFDLLVVGAGPSGLAAAIRFKQVRRRAAHVLGLHAGDSPSAQPFWSMLRTAAPVGAATRTAVPLPDPPAAVQGEGRGPERVRHRKGRGSG